MYKKTDRKYKLIGKQGLGWGPRTGAFCCWYVAHQLKVIG